MRQSELRAIVCSLGLAFLAITFAGCSSPKESPQQRAAAAQTLFDQTTKNFHLPSAEAQGADRDRLLAQAATAYEQLLKQYPKETHVCAQTTRSLANVRATQGRLDDAVNLYATVARKYPAEDWEILQSWKSAADLLADAGRAAEAKPFYEKILARFDKPDVPAVVKTIVRGSRARLAAAP
jgi:tetratricopeptide (TPR) repeat protein